MAIALAALWRSPTLRDVLEAASLPGLIGVQFYRTIGVVFLILLAQKQLPGYFALPAGSVISRSGSLRRWWRWRSRAESRALP